MSQDQAPTNRLEVQVESLSLGQDCLLRDLSFSLEGGQALSLMGPSGSGKSSLLAFIAGFLPPAFRVRGQVLLNGRDITRLPPEQRQVALMFQDPLLFAHMSAAENLRFGMPRALSAAEKRQQVSAALEAAGLAGFEDRDPATLSGGQKARVALLRALVSQPRALLLDEPFSKLDADLRQAFRGFVLEASRSAGLPLVQVTHDSQDAEALGGQCLDVLSFQSRR
jgi:putative thiamine transport system ATP-binding protein